MTPRIPRRVAAMVARALSDGAGVEWPIVDGLPVLMLSPAQAAELDAERSSIRDLLHRAAEFKLISGLLQDTSLLPSFTLPGAPQPGPADRCPSCGWDSPGSWRCPACHVALAIALDDHSAIQWLAAEIA
jgi:hypothetical protein